MIEEFNIIMNICFYEFSADDKKLSVSLKLGSVNVELKFINGSLYYILNSYINE